MLHHAVAASQQLCVRPVGERVAKMGQVLADLRRRLLLLSKPSCPAVGVADPDHGVGNNSGPMTGGEEIHGAFAGERYRLKGRCYYLSELPWLWCVLPFAIVARS